MLIENDQILTKDSKNAEKLNTFFFKLFPEKLSNLWLKTIFKLLSVLSQMGKRFSFHFKRFTLQFLKLACNNLRCYNRWKPISCYHKKDYITHPLIFQIEFIKPLAVISSDFLKPFARVDWDFFISSLPKIGYRNKFIHMIQVAYPDIQSKIKINGVL